MEDAYITLENGKFFLIAEHKIKQGNDRYTVNQYSSTDWNYKTNSGTWRDDGIVYRTSGGASYSPVSYIENGVRRRIIEQRITPEDQYEKINIIDGDTNKILLKWSDEWNVLVPDEIYKYGNKYIQWIHGIYKRYTFEEKWCHMLAESDHPLSGWKITSAPIDPIGIYPLYLNDKWYYFIEGDGGIYLGVPHYKSSPQPDPNPTPIGDKMIIELNDNVLSVINPIASEKYAWNVRYKDGATKWLDFGVTYDIPTSEQIEGSIFWGYAMSNKINLSNMIEYKTGTVEPPIDPPVEPPIDEKIKTEIRSHCATIENAQIVITENIEAIRDLLG